MLFAMWRGGWLLTGKKSRPTTDKTRTTFVGQRQAQYLAKSAVATGLVSGEESSVDLVNDGRRR